MLKAYVSQAPVTRFLIRFRDCDPFGHLYTANYIVYFHQALEDQMRKYHGLDIYGHAAETGHGWFVTSNQVSYLAPARLNESVLITMRMLRFDDNLAQLEGLMLDPEGKQLKAFAWCHFRFVDVRRGRPVRIDPALQVIFTSMLHDGEAPDMERFEARAAQVAAEFRRARREAVRAAGASRVAAPSPLPPVVSEHAAKDDGYGPAMTA